MLTIKKELANDVLKAELTGILDETVDLGRSLGSAFKEIQVSAKGISRINSLGLKNWQAYFHALRCASVRIRFFELSPSLVNQIHQLSGVAEKAEIASICVPYYCGGCQDTTLKPYTLPEVEKLGLSVPPSACQKCGGPAEFDEIAEEYLSFLDG